MYLRKLLFQDLGKESAFFWGARQTGKSTLLGELFPDSLKFDLLLSDVFARLQQSPEILREIIVAKRPGSPVIVDEIQKIPRLLDEIHWLITNKKIQFILCGSSPRKILRSGANLLGGRALRYELYPLIHQEVPDFDLIRALNHGLIPRHYLSRKPEKLIAAYIGSYLQEEIIAETKIRNIQSFTRFLEVAALSNGETLNFSNIATETGVSSPTVREYFQILEDTLMGRFLPAYRKKPKRRLIQSPKFYYFDIAIANYLVKRRSIDFGSESMGKAFEHFIYHELIAHSHYSGMEYPVCFWRTSSKIEVDFVLGEHEVAIEVKSSRQIHSRHLKGLQSLAEDYAVKHLVLVSNDPIHRKVGNITVLPWKTFLDELWAGNIIR